MNLELMGALNELEKERGISRDVLVKAIEDAIHSALRRSSQPHQNLRVDFDDRSGKVRVFARKAVVRHVDDPANQISLEEAQRINPRFEVDDVVEVELTLPDLGRIAAQTAKQVVVQRIREAERNRIYDEYHSREGDIITGIIRRIEHRNVYVDLGRAEAVLPPQEQVPTERYAPGVRMKFYLAEVRRTTKGPQVILSRSHPGLLKRLFELEVPEIHDGVVEVKAWAREPGHRSKIAVWSMDRNVDPVGACVGPRGARVQQVVKELRQEKVDVIAWDPDIEVFIANALMPVRALKVYLDPEERSARVIVPDQQLSQAIGKEGQNARLAAKLTGWRIDIKSEAQWGEVEQEFEAKRRRLGVGASPVASREAVAAVPEVARDQAEVVAPAPPAPAPPELGEVEAPPAPEELEGMEEGEPVPAEAQAEVEVEEEQPARAKAGGKVRRLKGARKFERRHLEEALEELEPLPSLFDDDQEQEQKAAQPAGQADEASTDAFRVGRPVPGGASLSVRLEDFLARKSTALSRPAKDRGQQGDSPQLRPAAEPSGPPAAVPRTTAASTAAAVGAAASAPSAAGTPPAPAKPEPPAKPPGSPVGRERSEAPPATGRGRDGEPARKPGPEPAPARQTSAVSRPQQASGAQETSGATEGEAKKKKGKVLKSLADLAFEDFGFERSPSKGKG